MLKKIAWNNHSVLGNLELDFSKPDNGGIYNTIILAGENGTGKTTVLETLSTFLNLGSIEPFKEMEYVINSDVYKIVPSKVIEHHEMGFHIREDKNNNEVPINTNRNNNFQSINADTCDIRHYGCVYSKARSGFNTQPVTTTTTQQLDNDKYENDNNEDFTLIKQLIVDISAQDDAAFRAHFQSMLGKSTSEIETTFALISKMRRFTNAFDSFFENMEYSKIDNDLKDEKRVLFRKSGIEIPVDTLSTGEKQIVFRGAHLLKNSGNINGGIILIDEPELSMHPKWQEKKFQYYRNLFKNDEHQIAQIIFATHSEYVIREGLEDRDNVLIIALTESSENIKANRITAPSLLPTITSAETNYIAFGIISNDYHIELYGYLQHKIGKDSVKCCDDYIVSHVLYNTITHAKPSSHGQTQYKTLPTYIRNAINHPDPNKTFTKNELETSIKLLIELCK